MITLITGGPGMGKTSLAVSMMLEELNNRPLFVMGVTDLKVEHFKCPPVAEWTELRRDVDDPSLQLPYFTFPQHAVIMVDESQRIFRPRSSGSKVPNEVAAFETHRHTGVDFWLITQHPNLIDANIRRLIGRHIHIKQTALGRYLYEWPECGDPDTKTSRDIASSRRYQPPKKTFDLYKSAEAHTKQKFRWNNAVIILALCGISFPAMAYYLYGNVSKRISKPVAIEQPKEQGAHVSSPAGSQIESPPSSASPLPIAAADEQKHPYSGLKLVMKGYVSNKGKKSAYFQAQPETGGQGFELTDQDLIEAGYNVQIVSGCLTLLTFNGIGLISTCAESSPPQMMAAAAPNVLPDPVTGQ